MTRFVLLLACLILPTGGAAQSACPGITQIDKNFCAKEKWQIADRELNRLWKEVKPKADARGTGKSLLNDQRTWLKKRDAACEPELKNGGSADAMFYWACMERQTLRRNDVLRTYR